MDFKFLKFIIDLDGFQVNGKFIAKEIGIYDVDSKTISIQHYKVGDFNHLNEKDRKTAIWLLNYKHGLQFRDHNNDYDQDSMEDIIMEMCNTTNHENRMIGYKGGIIERNLIAKHGGISYNIENLKCPKFEVLLEQYPNKQYWSCGRHRPLKNKQYTHCSAVEVKFFGEFVENYFCNNLF